MDVSSQLHAPATLPTDTHWIRGWVGPRANLDVVVRKIPSTCLLGHEPLII
jgi:hypothetical protein